LKGKGGHGQETLWGKKGRGTDRGRVCNSDRNAERREGKFRVVLEGRIIEKKGKFNTGWGGKGGGERIRRRSRCNIAELSREGKWIGKRGGGANLIASAVQVRCTFPGVEGGMGNSHMVARASERIEP